MSKFRFKPEHFPSSGILGEAIAREANAALDAYLKHCKKVFSRTEGPGTGFYGWAEDPADSDTHTALLFDLSPIEPCTHDNVGFAESKGTHLEARCNDCGTRVKAKWENI